jgi:undecaprenyl-diphosphatase
MPSSHTLFAAALSVFLTALYPSIRVLVFALAVVVGLGRVLFDAHWPTDVIVGGAMGWAIASWVVHNRRGVRLFGRVRRAESAERAG